MCHKKFENRFTNKNLMSKNISELAREIPIIQKCSTLDSGKFVSFGPLVSFSYMYIWCWFYAFLIKYQSFSFFPGKQWLPLVTISTCKNPYSETFLDVNFLFVNRYRFLKNSLIRLDGCQGCPVWSESSLGAQIILLVLSCSGSYHNHLNIQNSV